MISPELLRRFPFFAHLDDNQLAKLAMITNEDSVDEGAILFEENQPADMLYFLLEGGVDLYNVSEEKYRPGARKEFLVGEINPGEVFSISALVDPYVLNATGRASQPSRFLAIEASTLRQLLGEDCSMGYVILQQITKALLERLMYTRVQLAAARA
jgi:CRP-like cAMP-binding protein